MKVALLGYGKMGKIIEQVLSQSNKGHEVVLKITDENQDDLTLENLQKADVAIEFSTPSSAYQNILTCFDAEVPVIVGTTGWLDKLETVQQQCITQDQAFFHASNFSIGVNLFFETNKHLAKLMNHQPQYNVQVEETHHTQKLDAPSGTAITTAEQILTAVDRKVAWKNEATNKPDVLDITSYREEGVPGTHIVTYSSSIDAIEIKHTAHSRMGFAMGAVMAAEWIIGRKGCFTMKDLLGFG